MTFENVAFLGTILVAVAYIPQIFHLLVKHCAYGISIRAWLMWLIATALIYPHTLAAKDTVFISLMSVQLVAISFVLVFSYFHQGKVCKVHKIL
jgi:hypothetical protein